MAGVDDLADEAPKPRKVSTDMAGPLTVPSLAAARMGSESSR